MTSTITGFIAVKHCELYNSRPHIKKAIEVSKTLSYELPRPRERAKEEARGRLHDQKLMEKEEKAQVKVFRESQDQIS